MRGGRADLSVAVQFPLSGCRGAGRAVYSAAEGGAGRAPPKGAAMRRGGDSGGGTARRALRLLPLLLIGAALVLAWRLGVTEELTPAALAGRRLELEAFVAARPATAIALYLLVYVAVVAVSLPGASVLTLAGGFMFGWLLGGALTVLAATLGASLVFLAARTALGDFVVARAGARLARLASGFRDNAFLYLLSLRLAPVFPFWLVNLAPALFGMRLGSFALATFLGILPATFAYAYLGAGLGGAVGGEEPLLSRQVLLGFAALAVVALLPLAVRRLWPGRPGAAVAEPPAAP